jgi:uncharacterized membrane protein
MNHMIVRTLLAAGALSGMYLAAAPAVTPAAAMEYAWCAVHRNGSENCGFVSEAQCNNTVSGIGGFCRQSGWPLNGNGRRRR